MADLIREHQLDLMLALAGVCFAVTVCGAVSRTPKMKKLSLFLMSYSAMLLMIADRYAYIYRGNESQLGYYMVSICNFVTFLCPLMIAHSFNWYLSGCVKTDTDNKSIPLRLKLNKIIVSAGVVLLVISQFTGLYYTFDDSNRYQRSYGYIISYIFPLAVWLICGTVIISYRKSFSKLLLSALLVFSAALS